MATNAMKLLEEIGATDGVRETLVVGRDGFVIEHLGNMDAEAIGAILATALGAIETMGHDSDQGALGELIAEFDDGNIMIAPVGSDAVLGVITQQKSSLGRVRYEMKKRLKQLALSL